MLADNHFKIIVPSYNNEKWLRMCLRSVQLQNYDNYQCIIIDDCSSDKSTEVIKNTIDDDPRFVLIENTKRQLALKNIYDAIANFNLNDEDIIVTLDGDDWFATKQALEILNNTYKEKKCWITYGSYIEHPSLKLRGECSQKIPKEIIETNSFRESKWMSSHLRTFKYKLWKQIKKEDFLEEDGRFCDGAWDMIFMFPMLEMAGLRSAFVKDILHVYNRSNPLNEDKVDHEKLFKSEMRIRNMPRYERLIDDN